MSTDPYGQHYSPYLAMGNNPMMMIDPDGGFNVGATLVGAVTGFAVGSLIGLAVDKDNWWKYGAGGAAIGGIAGVASGNIDIDGAPFLTKTAKEIKIALGGASGDWGSVHSASGKFGHYGPGLKTVARTINVKWVLDASSQVVSGYARLRSSRKYSLEGVTKVMPDINISDQNNTVIPDGNRSVNSDDVVSRTPFLNNPQGFSAEIPEHSTQVNVSFSQPYSSSGHIVNYDGYWKFRTFSRHTNRNGTRFSSRQFKKRYVNVKIKKIHKVKRGGRLF